MRPVWEAPDTLPAAPLSYLQRRRLPHLRPPIDDPDTAAVWWRLADEEQGELMRLAAAGGTAQVAHHAVVVAALQRQIERREVRWNLWQLAAFLPSSRS